MASLPKHILMALRDNKTSLGEHPSYPPEEEEKFIVNLLSKVFDEISGNINIEDYDTIKNELNKILGECKKLEKNNIQALEELCVKIVNDIFEIPQNTIRIEANIVSRVNTDNERLVPEKTAEDFSFDDINDMNNLSDEIYKRRMLNALITGAAMYYMNIIGEYIKDVFNINSDLPSLYKKMIDYNMLLLYYEKETLDKVKTTDGGKVDVIIGSEQNCPIIKSEAVLFPILVEETIKGILELAISHGLPKNINKAKYIMSKADFKLAEVWDMRLGYALWKLLEKEFEKCDIDIMGIGINFFLMELSKLSCEDFNNLLQELFARTKKGKEMLIDLTNEISYNKDEDDFNNYIKTKNDTTQQIDDNEYFTPEELITDDEEEYFTPEELITDNYKY
jgi:hypothetical protein